MARRVLKENPEQLIKVYQWLRRYGLNDSHSGNASLRVGDSIWITPTGACADTLTTDELLECRLDASVDALKASGASQDASIHLAAYRANGDTRAILHSHAPHAVALSLTGKDFTPADLEGQLYFGRVRVLNIAHGDHFGDETAGQIAHVLGTDRVVIERGHGVYAAGESLEAAYKWTTSLALSAKITFLS